MDFVELYYNLAWGCYPFEIDDHKIRSQKIIDYLSEANISSHHILDFIEHAPCEDYLTPQMLPDSLWEQSLLLRDTFYYHNSLHLTSKAPIWSPITGNKSSHKFYMEMKIQYTMNDLLAYYYNLFNIEHDLRDSKKDSGSFNYLLNRFAKFSFIEPIDFVLTLMDYNKAQTDKHFVKNVLDILEFEFDVYDLLKSRTAEAELAEANRIIWR